MMRIAQLSRKLNISQSEITGFFKRRKIGGYGGGNTKLSDEHLRMVIEYFRPELITEFFKDDIESKSSPQSPLVPQEAADGQDEAFESVSPKPVADKTANEKVIVDDKASAQENPEKPEADVEVIRAPKIKLDGLKVVGKIELPEKPKKPETNSEKTKPSPDTEATEKRKELFRENRKEKNHGRRKPSRRFKGKERRRTSKEESYEEKLKRLEREKLQKQKAREKELREKKRQHYLKTVQAKQTAEVKSKSGKKAGKKKTTQETETIIRKKKIYRNPLRRFWAWLNGEFDEY